MNTIEQQETIVRKFKKAMDIQSVVTFDNETPENIKAFWEAYKAYHVEHGRLIEMYRKTPIPALRGCNEQVHSDTEY